jgi:hypothetical protein
MNILLDVIDSEKQASQVLTAAFRCLRALVLDNSVVQKKAFFHLDLLLRAR